MIVFRHKRLAGAALLAGGLALAVFAVGPRVLNRLDLQFGVPPVCSDQDTSAVIEEGAWTRGTDTLAAHGESRAAVLDGRIYQAGGLEPGGYEPSPAFSVYDPATDSWQALSPLPAAANHVGIAALGGRIYVTGGFDSADFANPDELLTDAAWVYDPDADRWTSIAALPSPRGGHVMVSLDDALYVIGGLGPDPLTVFVYDPAADTWDTSPSLMPEPARDHASGVALDGKIYLLGGRWNERGNWNYVDVYDPAADTWERKQSMPTARSGFTASVLDGRIHAVGGQNIDVGCNYSQHEAYEPATDTWIRLPDLPSARQGTASGVVDGRWFVIGGATGSGPRTPFTMSRLVEIFTLSS